MDELKILQGKLESLKHLMEQYFMGAEKRMPARQRDEVTKEIRRFQPPNDSVVRFKYQNLMQRMMTLERYWQRTIKAIDEGRYHRDVFKANYRAQTKTMTSRSTTSAASNSETNREAAAFMASLSGDTAESAQLKVKIRGERKRGKQTPPKIELRGTKRTAKDSSE